MGTDLMDQCQVIRTRIGGKTLSAKIIDGQAISASIRAEIAARVTEFARRTEVQPHLAAVLVGSDAASMVYVRNKRRACAEAGIKSSLFEMPDSTSQSELLDLVSQLNERADVHGILVQFPLPNHMDEFAVLTRIDPSKDVDAFHPHNVGLLCEGQPRFLPCTPAGVQQLLIRTNVEIPGKHVAIIGRSNLVGRPLSIMLSQKGPTGDATVTLCHSRTKDLMDILRQADILVAAIGKPQFVRGAMIKPGAVVIDVGINRLPDGRLVGDVHFEEALQVAAAVTPVPKGVGPMTIAMLLENTLTAAVGTQAKS